MGIGDYWFCYLEFIHEVVLEMIGFTGESTGYCCDFMWTGQTGLVLPVRPRVAPVFCVGFGFGLFVWISVIVSYLWLLDRYYAYVILLFANNESSCG